MKTLKELKAELAALDAQLDSARKDAYADALVDVRQKVEEFGFTAQQVFPFKAPAKKTVAAKYRDEKSGATWSGRGKAPAWIAGKNRDNFLIAPVTVTSGPFLAEMAAAAARSN